MSVEAPAMRPGHTFYNPASPTLQETSKMEPEISPSVAVETTPVPPPPFVAAKGLTAHIASQVRSASSQPSAGRVEGPSTFSTRKGREDSPVRFNTGSYGALSRERTISPPPRESAPVPPKAAHRQANDQLATYTMQAPSSLAPFKSNPSRQRRISATPKPFLRPLPVRPQAQHTNSSNAVQRRASAMPTTGSPSLATLASRSVTAPPRSASSAAVVSPPSHASTLHSSSSQTLRRPISVQVRSDPAPFLSSIRPAITISSTPSFVPGTGRRSPPAMSAMTVLHSSTSTGALRQDSLHVAAPTNHLAQRKSMPALGLPPPAPPPDIPLPAPPPNMPLPSPPPNMPLPVLPTSARQSLAI